MRKWVALALGLLVPLLGLAGVGNAQSGVQVQGTIEAIDCYAQTIVVATPTSTNTIAVAPYTAVFVDSQAVSLCDLQQYVGSQATVWLAPSGNEFVATRIDAVTQAAIAPVAASYQQEAIAPLPIAGIVLGTIALAGLIYLLVRASDNHYYRYPYYGAYYRHYYRPEYRPYVGYYPVGCPVVFAAAAITGFVLGVTVFGGYDYLLVRDRDGRYERYPYYGPYRSYYYRPEYRAYAGSFRGDAPVHYGDTHGTAIYHQQYQPQPYQRQYGNPPQYQRQYPQPNNYQAPQYQRQYGNPQQYQRQYPQPNNYQPRQQQYQRPNNGGGSRGRDSRQVCQSNGQGQSCSDGTHSR